MSAALFAVTLSLAAQAVVLDDPLRGSTSGTQNGGELSADGWRVTATSDHLYWHLPTLKHGAVEFSLRGLRAQEDRVGIEDKAELFHMYDWTFENADTNYGGYRNNPFKHFIRKTGVLDDRPGRTDSCELVWVIGPNYVEPDTAVLSWDPNVTYRFREEWGPDGAGNTVIRTYRDGVELMTMSEPGEWAPQGHAIRIGVARLTAESGAPLDAVFSDVQAWDLSDGMMMPGLEPAPYDALPQGPVRVVGNSLVDDNGAFLGLGATYMTALWQVKNDRAQLESDLTLFQTHGFNYLRILGQVGGDFWSGLEIAPVDLRNEDGTFVPAWPDYVQQLQDLLDVVWAHGMRTQITIFGGASNVEGGLAGRQTAVDLVLTAIAGREEKVILIEVANEGWHTGFRGAAGLEEMRAFAGDLDARTEVPVAITSNHDVNTIEETYQGARADIATWHTSRDLDVDEGWGPVWSSWNLDGAAGVPPVSSNEPIGPGSSVNSESTPIRLVMAAAFAYVAKLPMYVFHSSAGVRHVERFEDMAGVRDFANVRRLLPGDIASWTRNDGIEASAPFTATGCVRCTGARREDRFVTIPIGIRPEGLTLEARQPISFAVYDPITGALLSEHSLAAGEQLTLPQGGGAYLITNVDPTPTIGGLRGEYHRGIVLADPVLERVDPKVDFEWFESAPAGLSNDGFSIRWSGTVRPRYSESYTFATVADDGARLWIDGQPLIDDWNVHGPVEQTGTVDLLMDREYSIVLEYFENTGTAAVRLLWSSASQAREVIPSERLSPPRTLDAAFVRQDVPVAMIAGEAHPVSITMRNTGTQPWSGAALGARFGADRIALARDVAPGAEQTFVFDVTAPDTPGLYDLSWQMVHEEQWFGEITPVVSVLVMSKMAEVDPTPDAGGVTQDGASEDPVVEEDPTCSCRTTARDDLGFGSALLLLALFGLRAFGLRRSTDVLKPAARYSEPLHACFWAGHSSLRLRRRGRRRRRL